MDQIDKIDFVVLPSEKTSNKLILVIADADNFESSEEREKAFFDKTKYYFNYAISDSFKEKYNNIDLENIEIHVKSITPPTEGMKKVKFVAYPKQINNPKKRIPIRFSKQKK